MKEKNLFAVIGTSLGVIGTSMQTEDVLRIISLIITIVGGLITWIVIPIINWYNKAKEDGKINKEEVKELTDILDEGSKKIEEQVQSKGKEEENESKD